MKVTQVELEDVFLDMNNNHDQIEMINELYQSIGTKYALVSKLGVIGTDQADLDPRFLSGGSGSRVNFNI